MREPECTLRECVECMHLRLCAASVLICRLTANHGIPHSGQVKQRSMSQLYAQSLPDDGQQPTFRVET